MCQIASLYLVTEAERKHVRRRTRFHQHGDANCQVTPPPGAEGNSRHSDRNIRGTCTVKNWTTQNSDHPEIIDQIHKLILNDRRISAKSVAEQMGISRERVGSIIHEDLDMRKLSAKWVSKYLNADQKHERCHSSEQILEFFQHGPNDFLSRLVTMDETWLYYYDLETKQQSMEWQHSGSPRPQKIPSAKIGWKISRLNFLRSRRHHPHWLSTKGPNYQRQYYSTLLVQRKDILKEKPRGKITKSVLFLHDNAPVHRALAA